MKNCPECYNELEVKSVTPCYVCGGIFEPTKETESKEYIEYCLDDDRKSTLCTICYLEEFLSDQGDTRGFIGAQKDELRFQRDVKSNTQEKDKYCNQCNRRLALLKVKKRTGETFHLNHSWPKPRE